MSVLRVLCYTFEGNTKEGVSKGASRITLVRIDILLVGRSINDLEDIL